MRGGGQPLSKAIAANPLLSYAKTPVSNTVPNDTVTSVLKRVIMKNSIENGGCMKKGFTLAEGATHVANCNNMRKSAFTLAEVLITLGIIGIVAALIMPTLTAKIEDKVLENQVKKAKASILNGYKLMMAQEGIFNVSNLAFMNKCNGVSNITCVSNEHKKIFKIIKDSPDLKAESMPEKYSITGNEKPSPFDWSTVNYMYSTPDGMIFGVVPDESLSSFDVYVDVNGMKKPNVAVKDLRKYRFAGTGGNIFDVSSELEKVSQCSADNLSGCDTEEACKSLESVFFNKDAFFYAMSFKDGKCTPICNTHWPPDLYECNYSL